MRNSKFSLIILLCSLMGLSGITDANQAEQLKMLIKSTNFSSSSHDDSWVDSSPSSYPSPVHFSQQNGHMEADRITALPGQPTAAGFDQYSGYVSVDEKNGRALFYYFAESASNSSTKPLVLWLNGGPGCSSLGIGAMSELGPYRVNSDGKTLSLNNYAWNNVANVLFLESPAGVGYSYSNTTSDYDKSGDKRTAEDSYNFLMNWLERFPEYKTRAFFIAGESYAGHYIPQLAYTILQGNKAAGWAVINLQGIAIGNAYVDAVLNSIGQVEYVWNHALVSDETYWTIKKYCNFSSQVVSEKCQTALNDANDEPGNINPYNIYAPLCIDSQTSTRSNHATTEFDPCTEGYIYSYLNIPAVRKALHADMAGSPESWHPCRGLPWKDQPLTMEPIFNALIASNISIWLYSGDIDSMVPITSTRLFIKKLGLAVKSSWRPWTLNNEVGGYVEEYNGMTLATVRGAGHEVPSYQPERALHMITSFLQGQPPS